MTVQMVKTCEGIKFKRCLMGWIGQINGTPVLANNRQRGYKRWTVGQTTGSTWSRLCYGSGPTMKSAVLDAKEWLHKGQS